MGKIKTESDDFLVTESGDYVVTEDHVSGTTTKGRGSNKSYKRPTTFWKKFYYFYESSGKKRKRR